MYSKIEEIKERREKMKITIESMFDTGVTITEVLITVDDQTTDYPVAIAPGSSCSIDVPHESCTIGITYDDNGFSQLKTRIAPVSGDNTVTLIKTPGGNTLYFN
jgi:hypothetical protein